MRGSLNREREREQRERERERRKRRPKKKEGEIIKGRMTVRARKKQRLPRWGAAFPRSPRALAFVPRGSPLPKARIV